MSLRRRCVDSSRPAHTRWNRPRQETCGNAQRRAGGRRITRRPGCRQIQHSLSPRNSCNGDIYLARIMLSRGTSQKTSVLLSPVRSTTVTRTTRADRVSSIRLSSTPPLVGREMRAMSAGRLSHTRATAPGSITVWPAPPDLYPIHRHSAESDHRVRISESALYRRADWLRSERFVPSVVGSGGPLSARVHRLW